MKIFKQLSMLFTATAVLSVFTPAVGTQKNTYYINLDGDDKKDGSKDAPWKTITRSTGKLRPGDTLHIMGGTYYENVCISGISGEPGAPIRIVNFDGAEVIINGNGEETAFELIDCEHITVEGLRVTNARHGIAVSSTPEHGSQPLSGITIKCNTVYGIDGPEGGHAISVYGENSGAPITGLLIEGNEVFMNRLYWSEAVVVNGNIDGFIIRENVVYNNNNIGIDMIGFEETADDPAVDFARNGKVHNNVVYGSNTNGNEAYWKSDSRKPFGGSYDRCSNGIYVDGGSHIEIYYNFAFDNDIGIEVATEHEPPYAVTDVYVHDNIVASSGGWAGICFGGYNNRLGYTENCRFENNILFDNKVGIGIQNSRNNVIKGNVIVGGEAAVAYDMFEYGSDLSKGNDFGVNYWQNADDVKGYFSVLDRLPEEQWMLQVMDAGFGLLKDPSYGDFVLHPDLPVDIGTSWRPDGAYLSHYAAFYAARGRARLAAAFLQEREFRFDAAVKTGNLRSYLNGCLQEAGFADAEVLLILKAGAGGNAKFSDGVGIVSLTVNNVYGFVSSVNDPDGLNSANDASDVNRANDMNGAINGELLAAAVANAHSGTGQERFTYMAQVIVRFDDNGVYAQWITDDRGVVMVVGAGMDTGNRVDHSCINA